MQRELCSSWSILDQDFDSTLCTSLACSCRSGCCIMVSPCICNRSFKKAWINSKFEFDASSDLIILSKLLKAASSASLLSTSRTCMPCCVCTSVRIRLCLRGIKHVQQTQEACKNVCNSKHVSCIVPGTSPSGKTSAEQQHQSCP